MAWCIKWKSIHLIEMIDFPQMANRYIFNNVSSILKGFNKKKANLNFGGLMGSFK